MSGVRQPTVVRIPGGTFQFGVPRAPDSVLHRWSGPHEAHVGAFLMAAYPVTVAEFIAFATDAAGSVPAHFAHMSDQRPDWPANGISWEDARDYAAWMRERSGKPYRLPSCDEWEAAARGGLRGRRFPWGDEAPDGRCNYAGAGPAAMMPVGSFEPNGYGLYDMSGSIWNWCEDLWCERISGDPPVNRPTGRDPRLNRVLRGGSYMTADPGYVMCAYIHEDPPDLRHPSIGLRLACDLQPQHQIEERR